MKMIAVGLNDNSHVLFVSFNINIIEGLMIYNGITILNRDSGSRYSQVFHDFVEFCLNTNEPSLYALGRRVSV